MDLPLALLLIWRDSKRVTQSTTDKNGNGIVTEEGE